MKQTNHKVAGRIAALAAFLALGACASSSKESTPTILGTAPAAAHTVLVDTRGERHDVDAALKAGRQVAFVFWQPWCSSCKAEAPIANEAAKEFAASMDVIGVVSGPEGSVDEDAMKEALFSWGMSYPSVRDTDMSLTNAFEVIGVPMIVVINPDGSIAYRAHAAPAEWAAE